MLTGKRLQYLADLLPENVLWGDPLDAGMLEQILTAHSAGAREPVVWRHKWTNDHAAEWAYKEAGPKTDELRIGIPGVLGPDSHRECWEPLYAHPQPMPLPAAPDAAPSPDREQVGNTKEDRYQMVCAAAYQLAGVVNAPLRFLDALSDAANGEPMNNAIDLLPVTIDEFGSASPSRECGERQGAATARVCDTCSDGDCLADNAGLPCPFSVSLRSIDEHDPQSFINGVKWAREHAASAPTLGGDKPIAAWLHVFSIPGKRTEFASIARDVDIPEDFVRANQKGLVTHTVEPLYREFVPTMVRKAYFDATQASSLPPQWIYDFALNLLAAHNVEAQEPAAYMWRDGGAWELTFDEPPQTAMKSVPLYAHPQLMTAVTLPASCANECAIPLPTTDAARDMKRWREKIIHAMRAPSRGDFTVEINATVREMTAEIERLDRANGE